MVLVISFVSIAGLIGGLETAAGLGAAPPLGLTAGAGLISAAILSKLHVDIESNKMNT
jgi:uncharacterized membrane protein YhiD involved in acid resistance